MHLCRLPSTLLASSLLCSIQPRPSIPTMNSSADSIEIQGGSLRTWSYSLLKEAQVILSTEGRPLDASVEVWHGPDNVPTKMRVYNDDGWIRPFNAVLHTRNRPSTIAIRNIGQLEFPIVANIVSTHVEKPLPECIASLTPVQGGALRTYPFDPFVDSVQVLLKTDGRPLNSRVEILQGPCNNKQVVELYTEDGFEQPVLCIVETPGPGNVIRVINTGPVEFPILASVVPYRVI